MSEEMSKRIRNVIKAYLSIGGVLLAYYLIVTHFDIGVNCIFRRLTGLKCPGCGNTRAVLAILHKDFKASLSYNLMLLPELAFVAWAAIYTTAVYLKTGVYRLAVKHEWTVYVFIAVLLAWGVVRNVV